MNKIITASLFLLLSIACGKQQNRANIPNVPVNIQLVLTDPAYFNLSVVGGWLQITGGSRGIIIYRLTTTEFTAFDRHCTFEPTNNCARVSVDSTNVFAVDTCCGSQFLIVDGSVQQGPAVFSLKQYQTFFSNNILTIKN